MNDIDDDTLAKYAAEALTRPDNFGRHVDLGQYETHGHTMSLVHNDDDLLAESNWYATIKALTELGCADDFYVTGERHWACGNIDSLYVRVYDADGRFTTAWREACGIAKYLRDDYPVLNEEDLSERENEAFESEIDDVLNDEDNKFDWDEPDEHKVIGRIAVDLYREDCEDAREVDRDLFAKSYVAARDEYFTGAALAFLTETRLAERATYDDVLFGDES